MLEKQALTGAWRLVSYEARSPDGTQAFPFGIGATGMIIWDTDGFFNAQINPGVASGDTQPSYIAYFGRWEFDDAGTAVLHHVEGAYNKNLRDTTQRRLLTFDGDRVTLTPPAREGAVTMSLLWERIPPAGSAG
jgi:lipocalin-like protein